MNYLSTIFLKGIRRAKGITQKQMAEKLGYEGELLGYTGMTGKATGIHLHLGVKPLTGVSNVNAVTYSVLNGIALPYIILT